MKAEVDSTVEVGETRRVCIFPGSKRCADLCNQLSILRGSDQPRFDLRGQIGKRTDIPRSTSPNRPDSTSFDQDSERGGCKATGQSFARRPGKIHIQTWKDTEQSQLTPPIHLTFHSASDQSNR